MTDDLRARLRSLPAGNATPSEFDPSSAPARPEALFIDWLDAAIDTGLPLPHAATLATADSDARTLILKDVTARGFWFATRTDGRKAAQIAAGARATLVFFWPALSRQVRVHGHVEFADEAQSRADFAERPAHSRASALLGTQSAPLPADVDYAELFAAAKELAAAEPSAGVATWAAAVLVPERIEFWASTPRDGQVRLEYSRAAEGTWVTTRLWP